MTAMLSRSALVLAAPVLAALAIAACGPAAEETGQIDQRSPAPSPPEAGQASDEPSPVRPAALRREAQIDWQAARRDLAGTPQAEMGGSSFSVQSGETAPPVPVLLPRGLVMPEMAGGDRPRFRELPDGYYAVYPGPDYSVTVNGTNVVRASNDDAPADRPAGMRYTSTMWGAQVALSRYGADYLVEFECKSTTGAQGGDCITEDEALAIAERLTIAGTR